MALVGLTSDNKQWLEAARPELIAALNVDFSTADLLLKLIAVDLKLNNTTEAQSFYEQFKRVNPKSPLIKLVDENNRQQQQK